MELLVTWRYVRRYFSSACLFFLCVQSSFILFRLRKTHTHLWYFPLCSLLSACFLSSSNVTRNDARCADVAAVFFYISSLAHIVASTHTQQPHPKSTIPLLFSSFFFSSFSSPFQPSFYLQNLSPLVHTHSLFLFVILRLSSYGAVDEPLWSLLYFNKKQKSNLGVG